MINLIHPDQLKRALNDGREMALLDVRERGRYARGHLLLAINLPLSHLELRIKRFVPRSDARVILCDEANGYAARAAKVLATLGYTDVRVIEGGVTGLEAKGFEMFRGHYAVPYAFGLYVSEHYRVPQVTPQKLKKKLDAGEPLITIDSRRPDEFSHASIPGAINIPLGELPCRIYDLVPDPDIEVVISCGAVTRGVLGCRSLLEAGLPNPVSFLTNGVRGWDLAGLTLDRNPDLVRGETSPDAMVRAVVASQRLIEPGRVRFITDVELDQWRDDPERTLYVVDVRTRGEYEAGHLPGSIWIPGGELAGLYEDHIGTRNARFCLVDDNGSRATVTAAWLNRMGWPDVAVLTGGVEGRDLIQGPEGSSEIQCTGIDLISPRALAAQLESDPMLILDFADSSTYSQEHIPGAWWALRSGLPDLAHSLPDAVKLVVTCPNGRLSSFAAADLGRLTDLPVSVLEGGTEAWRAAGYDRVAGLTRTLGEVDDISAEFGIRPGDDRVTAKAAQRRMVAWQEELLEKIERDETFAFPVLPVMTE